MEEIAISKFKATCLSVLENVRKTGKTVLVTRFGEPSGGGRPCSCVEEDEALGGVARGNRPNQRGHCFSCQR